MKWHLNSSRLHIRPLKDCDLYPFKDAVNASLETLSPWLEWCQSPFDTDTALQWVKLSQQHWIIGNSYELGLFLRHDDSLVGAVTIDCINTFFNQANLGYWIHQDHNGQGFATEAVEAIKAFAFEQLGLTRLELIIHPENCASIKVAHSVHAEQECLAKNRLYFKRRPVDAWVYSLTP
ncbi:GNAT family N-acetyltransferase [Thaumasiovibrio subtropicus]|uniref:GNAT family N-acetyltransferase n=1 Tax=Thaumasiovibrio subtropicus TaxID=1891207 RepID=UPI000B3602EF|nr:GNAT family protein [Thaumasiovibrio subtropicus]